MVDFTEDPTGRLGSVAETARPSHHFAFLMPPARGHVNPSLGLAEELLARGHRVTYLTGPAVAEPVMRTGANLAALPLTLNGEGINRDGFSTPAVAGMLLDLLNSIRPAVPDILSTLRQDPPDVICHDSMFFGGEAIAFRLGVPGVQLVPHFAENGRFSLADPMAVAGFEPMHPSMMQVGAAAGALVSEILDEAPARRSSSGSMKLEVISSSEAMKLVLIPKEFQLSAEVFDDSFKFIGPTWGARWTAADWTPPEDAAPVLLISMGSIVNDKPEFFRLCSEAFADTPWHVVLAGGHHVDFTTLPPLPANFEAEPFLPQPAVLRHASAFVTHAGMSSVMEACQAQVPMLAVPQTAEGAVNARRIAELGLGTVVSNDSLTADRLRAETEMVSNSAEIRMRHAEMRAHLDAAGGAAAGADALERLIHANKDD